MQARRENDKKANEIAERRIALDERTQAASEAASAAAEKERAAATASTQRTDLFLMEFMESVLRNTNE